MLTAFPKFADRRFIGGYFLPALLFSLALFVEFRGILPGYGVAVELEKSLPAVYFILGIWILSTILSIMNYQFYRFLEGYTFPASIRNWLIVRKKLRFRKLVEKIDLLYVELSREDNFVGVVSDLYVSLRREMNSEYPANIENIMPTSFGNAIRAFEYYLQNIYGETALQFGSGSFRSSRRIT
jgi:hypothetical protein